MYGRTEHHFLVLVCLDKQKMLFTLDHKHYKLHSMQITHSPQQALSLKNCFCLGGTVFDFNIMFVFFPTHVEQRLTRRSL